MSDMPLKGLRVVELGNLIAAPFATRLLAEFGAEVVKIETPGGGDPLRQWRKIHNGTSLWWSIQARNKRSITVNLKSEEGQEIVRRLVGEADVLVENFKPGMLERFSLGWDQLSQVNPKLVMVRISGYGQSGPYKDQPGYGAVGEALGGLRYVTGEPGRVPVRTGISIGDSIAALYAAFSALAAIHHVKLNGGEGQVVDIALTEAVFSLMESSVPEYDLFGFIRERSGGALPGIAPSNSYRCADEAYVIIAGNSDSIFKRLMKVIGRPDLAEDPDLAHNPGRAARAEELDLAIERWTREHNAETVVATLQEAQVPASKIYSIADILADPHFQAREIVETAELKDGTKLRLPAVLPKMSATPGRTRWLGPELGEHTDEVLKSLGYSPSEIEALRGSGAI